MQSNFFQSQNQFSTDSLLIIPWGSTVLDRTRGTQHRPWSDCGLDAGLAGLVEVALVQGAQGAVERVPRGVVAAVWKGRRGGEKEARRIQ